MPAGLVESRRYTIRYACSSNCVMLKDVHRFLLFQAIQTSRWQKILTMMRISTMKALHEVKLFSWWAVTTLVLNALLYICTFFQQQLGENHLWILISLLWESPLNIWFHICIFPLHLAIKVCHFIHCCSETELLIQSKYVLPINMFGLDWLLYCTSICLVFSCSYDYPSTN